MVLIMPILTLPKPRTVSAWLVKPGIKLKISSKKPTFNFLMLKLPGKLL